MGHFFHDHWMSVMGTTTSVLVAQANMPTDLSGFEKIGALGLLGIFMWFTLVRLEAAIKANSSAIERLIDHLDK
jgi:hypothetical protein